MIVMPPVFQLFGTSVTVVVLTVGLVVVGVADSGVVVGFVEAAVADVLGNPAEWYSAHVSR